MKKKFSFTDLHTSLLFGKSVSPAIIGLIISFSVIGFKGYSQQGAIRLTPTIIPPSPTVSELAKYGLVPVGLSTGTVSPEISLYNFKTQNLSLPISLSYNSNGVKVDEVASWVGMHWSLNSGGVVSRIVRDEPDLVSKPDRPYPADFNISNAESVSYIETAGNSITDTEPDLFTFNFLGYTGKFVFDRNGEIISMPRSDLRIERTATSGPGNFVITTPDGIKCTFDSPETSTLLTSYDASFPTAVTAWYLTRIEHPQGDVINLSYENSGCTYYMGFSQTIAKNTQRNSCVVGAAEVPQIAYCPLESSSYSITQLQIGGKRLSRIDAAGYGTVDFSASKDRIDLGDYKLNGLTVKDYNGKVIKQISFSYVFSNNPGHIGAIDYVEELKHRMFLNTVSEKDATGKQIRIHQFNYDDIDGLPARMSYSQDHWGYFNGAINHSFLPTNLEEKDHLGQPAFAGWGGNRELDEAFTTKGMLKKITYPTAGTSTFTFEANTHYTQKIIYPQPTTESLSCTGREGSLPVVKSITIASPTDQMILLQASSQLLPGYTSTQIGADFSVVDGAGNPVAGQVITLNQGVSEYIQLLANKQYTFTLTARTNGDSENNTSNYLSFQYYSTAPQIVFDNVSTGGVRISDVLNYDPFTGKTEKTKYYYARHDQLTKSSGRISGNPDYVTRYFVRTSCVVECSYYDCPYVALHSSNVSNLFLTSNHIYYEYVSIGRGESTDVGIEEHQFTVTFDNMGVQMWGADYIKDAPLSNTAWDNSKETDLRYFASKNGTLILIKQVHQDYTKDSRYHKEVPGLVVRKKYEPMCKKDAVYPCDNTNISEEYKQYTCVTQHDHSWYLGFVRTRCIAMGANMAWVTYMRHPCYGKQPGESAVLVYELEYLDALEYKNISDWVYLNKTTETTYDENGQNPVVEEIDYIYDNEEHIQLSRVLTHTSDGKQVETSTKYAPDYASEGNDVIASMMNYNMINVPIKNETFRAGNQVTGEVTIYNVKGQPVNVYQYESKDLKPAVQHNENQIIPSSDYKLKTKVEFDPATNNVSQVQLVNDFSTVYLWGYHGTRPIAEVTNAENGTSVGEFQLIHTVSANVSISSPETSLSPAFQVFSNQTINPSINVVANGSGVPPSPMLTAVLKRSDGTWVHSHNSSWGEHTMGSISITPGVYQWFYFGGDIVFDANFTGLSFAITTNYVGRKLAYKVFHTSFEDNGVVNASAKTGEKIWEGEYQINVPGGNGNYKLSYWKKTGLNPWILIQQDIAASSTAYAITIGENGSKLDEVRLYPAAAQMTTYTYDPLVGVTSSTDLNNVTTYYRYDGFGRLSALLDEKGNVTKSYVYHYVGQH